MPDIGDEEEEEDEETTLDDVVRAIDASASAVGAVRTSATTLARKSDKTASVNPRPLRLPPKMPVFTAADEAPPRS